MDKIIINILNSAKKILVIGDIMLDQYVSGDINRLSPEAPIPVLSNAQMHYKLGGAANVCINIHSLGIKVDLMGCIGTDSYGDDLLNILCENNISSEYVFRDNKMLTTVKTRYLSNTGHQLIRVDQECYYEYPDLNEIVQQFQRIIENYEVIILSDYAKGFLNTSLLREILLLTKKYNKRTIVDPKSNNIRKYDGCYLVKPNKEELRIAATSGHLFRNYPDSITELSGHPFGIIRTPCRASKILLTFS